MVKFGDLEVPVLFSETHYGEDWEKVKILCIKRPLTDASFEFHDDEVGKYFTSFYPKIEFFCIHFYCKKWNAACYQISSAFDFLFKSK